MWIEANDGKLLNPVAIGIRMRASKGDWEVWARANGCDWEIVSVRTHDTAKAILRRIKVELVKGTQVFQMCDFILSDDELPIKD